MYDASTESKHMKPAELATFLDRLVRDQMKLSTMIWGPPGIGKSSIVAQIAAFHGLPCIDLRLSQLAPTDLRGLPVAKGGIARWAIPEFLPRSGAGILFLDEINLAPPTMQGMAQQLILDRRVGSYTVPEGWLIWAAGNRAEDRAAVFDMPAPLANRFIHLDVQPDLESFKQYALASQFHEQIVAFVTFRVELLHKLDQLQPAWPSPRSWAMASDLHRAGLDVAAAVGSGAASEFYAYIELYRDLPDLDLILNGSGDHLAFPDEPSLRYALVVGLTARALQAEQGVHVLLWLAQRAPLEWVELCAADLFRLLRARKQWKPFLKLVRQEAQLQTWLQTHQALVSAGDNADAT
jgi:MoxR-like ATPase